MALLAPTALALGLLAVPILLLYMLRQKRRDRLVSSTLLWRDLIRDRTANAPCNGCAATCSCCCNC